MGTSRVRVRACAKINLVLRVLGTRPDCFHDLHTVFQSIELHDTLDLTARPGPFAITCTDSDVPTDDGNLVWRAAARLWTALGRTGAPRDVEVAIAKRIPMQAGLGGGSADATSALVGLRHVWDGPRSTFDLHALAASVGADAAFFLMGGTALGLGKGDDLYPLEDVRPSHVVLALPSFGVSTVEAYRWFDEALAAGAARPTGGGDRLAAWPTRDLVIHNDLQAPVTRRHPEIADLVAALHAQGAVASAMTGSGSAVFGLFDDEPAASHAAAQLMGAGRRVLLTRTITRSASARGLRAVPVRRR